MASRDVEINLIGHDRTGKATRSAANNLDRLAAKVDKFNGKNASAKVDVDSGNVAKIKQTFAKAGDNAGKSFAARFRRRIASVTDKVRVKVKVDMDKGVARVRTLGTAAGNMFANAMASAINDGSRAIGNALRRALLRMPALQGLAALIVARLLGFIGQALTAGFGLLLGPALLAAPIAFLLKKQLDASKQVTIQEKKVAGIKKRLEAAKSKDVRERLQKELAAEQRILAEQAKQAALWDRLKSRAKGFLAFISAPLKLPFADALDAIGNGLERLQVPLRNMMAALGPALAPFTKGVMDGLLAFIKALEPALPGIVAGMQAWGAAMPRIGTALGHMIAQIMKDPEAVTTAIEGIVGAIEDLAVISASVIRVLTILGNAFTTFGTNIDALETGKLGQLTGFFRIFGTVAHQAVILALTGLDALFSSLAKIPFVGTIFQGAATAIHTALGKAQQDFINTKEQWAATDAAIAARKIKAKITADIRGLETKLAIAKQKLKDPKLSKAKKVKIEANIRNLELKIATAKAKKAQLAKKPSISKLQATAKDLESKIRASKRGLDSVKNKKTRAKIEANIRQAEAQVRAIKGQIASIRGKTVSVNIIERYSRSGAPGTTTRKTAGTSWGEGLSGSAMHRTGGPTPVTVEAPIVNTSVRIDGHELAAVIRTQILDENKRQAYRARVGRRG